MLQSESERRSPLLPVAIALVTVGTLLLVAAALQPSLHVIGVADGGAVTPAAFGDLRIEAGPATQAQLDGVPVPLSREGERAKLDVPAPAEGRHTLVVTSPGEAVPGWGASKEITFDVDATPPAVALDVPEPVELGQPSVITGRALGAETVTALGETVDVADDGSFSVPVQPGTAAVDLAAVDAAGNTATRQMPVHVKHPGMRAVHVSALAWSSDSLREPILQMAKEGRINTVQLDIKDESGEIGYASKVPLALEIGASKGYYDARAALDQLHAAGLRVVGRVVAFRDPILAEASWASGRKDRVLQQADGSPWSGKYGKYAFTNFANPDVRGYNIALAEEAAELGFDEILYDYVRRPDGKVSSMRIAGLNTTPEQSIADFVGDTRSVIRKHGALLGASVYGIAATRPTEIAQDISKIADRADYVAPMVYPSHWGNGEYGVANPEAEPYDITARSLADFRSITGGRHNAVIPWLQAFSLRHTYGPAEVRAQIEAAESNGMSSFLLWNASCRYDAEGLVVEPFAP
ncbi:putative glycoside hydrolase [Actinomycetes bacterium KLBMP 9759]